MPRSDGGCSAAGRCDRIAWSGSRRAAEQTRAGRFVADAELASLAGVAIGELRRIVTALGYRAIIEHEQEFFIGKPRRRSAAESIHRRMMPRDGHPFAKLKELNIA
jgi:hypothetical protein